MRKHTYEIRKSRMEKVIETHDKAIAYHERERQKILDNLQKLEEKYISEQR